MTKTNNTILIIFLIILMSIQLFSQEKDYYGKFTIARLKYGGGGDWYSDQSSIPNLLEFINENIPINAYSKDKHISIMDNNFFAYPYIYMTGHGNIKFTDTEILRLRKYLTTGGFLHADDNYGMDKSFRREIKRVFPNIDLVEIPYSHPIFHMIYKFPNGLPKIHEHDNKQPVGLGIFVENRLVVFYSYESDLGDGWESQNVHNDPEEKRLEALKMGANIIMYSLTH